MGDHTHNVPERSDIPDRYKWDLTSLYASDEELEAALSNLIARIHRFPAYADVLSNSADDLLACLEEYTQLQRSFEKASAYTQQATHQDATDPHHQSLAIRTEALRAELSSAVSFLVPAILAMPEHQLAGLLAKDERLRLYKGFLDEIVRSKPHVLSPPEERLLAMAVDLSQAPSNIFNIFNNADIKFPSIKDEDGRTVPLTNGRYMRFLESRDREVRKAAFYALDRTYLEYKDLFAATLSSHIKANMFNARARGHSSARAAALFADAIPEAVYDNLIDTVEDRIHLLHRYMSLRKRALGLDALHGYDLSAPLVKDAQMKIPYESAVKTVMDALAPLGEQYLRDLDHAFRSGWVDVYENKGKRSGAYTWGHYDAHPYVLLNHTDSLLDVYIIAHEMGHAMHSFYSWQEQPYIYANYKTFVAEVASTFNEALLTEHLLRTVTGRKQRMAVLEQYFNSIERTLFRQSMLASFEHTAHRLAEEGVPLTAEVLCSRYHDLNVKYFGPDVVIDPETDIEWAKKPHLYMGFYVFQYATGFSAAALSQKVLSGEPGALERYLGLLKSGSSEHPLDELRRAGVDMAAPEPVISCLDQFEAYLDEFERLLEG